MCLIIASETGKLPADDILIRGHIANPDAWGVCWSLDGKVEVVRGFRRKTMLAACHKAEGNPYLIHFRWATHGTRNVKNTHPFRLYGAGIDLYMAHNGILSIDTSGDKNKSDTHHFADILTSELTTAPEWYQDLTTFQENIEDYIGVTNKVAFLDSSGAITICHRNMGFEYSPDIWMSNHSGMPVEIPISSVVRQESWWRRSYHESITYYSAKRTGNNITIDLDGESGIRMSSAGNDDAPEPYCDYCGETIGPEEAVWTDGNTICWECDRTEKAYSRHETIGTI